VARLDRLILMWGLRNGGEPNTILPVNADPQQVRNNSDSTNGKVVCRAITDQSIALTNVDLSRPTWQYAFAPFVHIPNKHLRNRNPLRKRMPTIRVVLNYIDTHAA
jgi:hypothetical protein